MAMSKEECACAMAALGHEIENYARLLIKSGVNIQKDQPLYITAPVEACDFVRQVVRAAYEAGASQVTINWVDDVIRRLEFEYVSMERFENTPSWIVDRMNSLAEQGCAFLWLIGEDPSILEGVDPKKPAVQDRAFNKNCNVFREALDFGRNAWCIAGVPVVAWAREVFPGLSDDEAMYKLWNSILYASRATGDDPQAAWETHNQAFKKNLRFLNEKKFDKLHYTSSNGTDLTIGLPEGHIWEGGAAKTQAGVIYFPNIPTEEIFTSPDYKRVDGIIKSALPLVYQGNVIREFWFEFKNGEVVDFGAETGKEVLAELLATDEGSKRLGEVALVSKNTPIRESGTLFYETLYDENASCHLALGKGFPECIKDGFDMTKEQLLEHGVNHSHAHVDFMVGADDLNIMGITKDGNQTRIFVNGQWAWE